MKNNLGRVIFTLFFLLNLNLSATTYEWSIQTSKESAYINEAIYLKYVCRFDDDATLYVIEFNPVADNDNYRVEILREEEKIVDGKKINSYEFILFVKKAGPFVLKANAVMKKTNKDSIENSVLGRDNANYEEFSKAIVEHENINIKIKKLATPLVGEFSLQIKQDEAKVKAYVPYHLELKIEGIGNFDALKDINYEIDGVKVFSEDVMSELKLTPRGYRGSWTKKFAFIGDKDFKVPAFEIEYFDLKSQTLKVLSFEGVEVKVLEASYTKKELLDEETQKFTLNKEYIYYVLTFLAGFILAKINFKRVQKKTDLENGFCQKIQKSKSVEEVCVLLVLEDSIKYNVLVNEIESKKLTSLSKIKKLICS